MTADTEAATTRDLARRRLATALERRGRTAADTCESAAKPRRQRTRAPLPRHEDSGASAALESAIESAFPCAMTTATESLPDDVDALRALIAAERATHAATTATHTSLVSMHASLVAEHKTLADLHAKLEQIVSELRRAHFGRKSERIDDNQLALALEDLEIAAATLQAAAVKAASAQTKRTPKPRTPRAEILAGLPRDEVVIEPESTKCPCCNGALHKIGEDTSERLDKIPAQLRVIVTKRPKYACRNCEKNGADDIAGIIQAPAPARLIEGGLPTERFVADVMVSKYADHLPLYRQSQINARGGVKIERATYAGWVGTGAAELGPLHARLVEMLKASPKLFADETRCPVLDPGRGKTKTGFLWALARDDRPWNGELPPAVAYTYAPGRGGPHGAKLLDGFKGVLQVDGYAVYKTVARVADKKAVAADAVGDAVAPSTPDIVLAFCWSHLRRKFYELYAGGKSPIATEALARIQQIYAIEGEIRGQPPEMRRRVRQEKAKPIVEALKPWFEACHGRVSQGGKLGDALAYGLNHWDGLSRYLDDGRIEIDSNTVERGMRGIALNRKNALFAGHDVGAENWAVIASLFETCKLNGVDPLAWTTDVLTKLVNRWPASRIDELMPWAWSAAAKA
jgi:transposase